MTQNQLQYMANKESQRSHLAQEAENKRANMAREYETNRSNLANEKENNRANLAREKENTRSNKARERETNRSNLANEALGLLNLEENRRRNDMTYDLGQQQVAVGWGNIGASNYATGVNYILGMTNAELREQEIANQNANTQYSNETNRAKIWKDWIAWSTGKQLTNQQTYVNTAKEYVRKIGLTGTKLGTWLLGTYSKWKKSKSKSTKSGGGGKH